MPRKMMAGLLAATTVIALSTLCTPPAVAQRADNKAHHAHHAAHKSSPGPKCGPMCEESEARAAAYDRINSQQRLRGGR
jgi:hypothetical protein